MKKFFLISMIFFIFGSSAAKINPDELYLALKSFYEQKDKDLRDYLIDEMTKYLITFPEDIHAPEISFLLAKLYNDDGNEEEAFLYNMAVILVSSANGFKELARNEARMLINNESKFRDKQMWILEQLAENTTDTLIVDGFFTYLNFLQKLDMKDLNDEVIERYKIFQKLYNDDSRNDQVQLWLANAYAQKGEKKWADQSYEMFLHLYPESQIIPDVLYARANHLFQEMNNHEQAIAVFGDLIEKYPGYSLAGEALYKTGMIYKDKLKDYQTAIKSFEKLAVTYPDYYNLGNAWFITAELYKDKIKDYPQAISAYENVVTRDKNLALKALEEIADIYKKRVNDLNKTVETYERIVTMFPDYDKAIDRLFDAAEICEDEMHDNKKAIYYYELIIVNYPDHKKSQEAKRRIKDIEPLLAPQPEATETTTEKATE